MVGWNITLVVFESDDSNLFHTHDWPSIQRFAGHPNLSISVSYYSKHHPERNTRYTIRGGTSSAAKLKPVTDKQSFSRAIIDACLDGYDSSKKNAVFFSMHCYVQSLWAYNTSISLLPWVRSMQRHGYLYEFICMDCCYMSSLNAAIVLNPVATYLIGCESASPNLGYVHRGLARQLASCSTTERLLRVISKSFIRRNNATRNSDHQHYTDSVVLDLRQTSSLVELLSKVRLRRIEAALAEPDYSVIYDLWELIRLLDDATPNKSEIFEQIQKMVVMYRQSNLLKYQPWSSRLHGLSIGLGGKHTPASIRVSSH